MSKKSLSVLFCGAMRSSTKTADAKTVDPPIQKRVSEILSSLNSSDNSSNTGQDNGEWALAGHISSALDVKFIQERNGHKSYFKKNTLETSDFLPKICLPSQEKAVREPWSQLSSHDTMKKRKYKKKQSDIMEKLTEGCVRKLGTETTVKLLNIVGIEAGENEYKAGGRGEFERLSGGHLGHVCKAEGYSTPTKLHNN